MIPISPTLLPPRPLCQTTITTKGAVSIKGMNGGRGAWWWGKGK